MHRDHVTCTCPSYKYNTRCKHGLCITNKEGILKEHIEFVLTSPHHSKPLKSGFVGPEKNAAGKKGGTHKNPWRPNHRNTNTNVPLAAPAQVRTFTQIHHNNEPLVVCFLNDKPKATECKWCGMAFPRRFLVAPYDCAIALQEMDVSRSELPRQQVTLVTAYHQVLLYKKGLCYEEIPILRQQLLRHPSTNCCKAERCP